MKTIKVPYSNSFQSNIIIPLLISLPFCGLLIMIFAITNKNWIDFLIGSLVGIPPAIILWKIMTLQLLILTKDLLNHQQISNINDHGFSLMNNEKENRIYWSDILDIELEKENLVCIRFLNRKKVEINNEYSGWYLFLKKIPSSKLKSSKIPDFLEWTYSNLESCQVCGSISMNDQKCLSCHTERFNHDLEDEFETEAEYLRYQQLELFCTYEESEEVDFHEIDNDGFEKDTNWRPLVSEKEVIEYSREHYWDI
ncbi:hypothetical protein [Sediminitomix flava]|uniref:Uncharacterized protein n=1 Tax=Sediminitomix flava TaxID=379075 RepID=A0A315ZEP7_SEDFL|nr:hypothetical protein [Sediminitomix flava]PWJ43194.1 hypothetical protein BC781_102743 [Sediminitomix flava]